MHTTQWNYIIDLACHFALTKSVVTLKKIKNHTPYLMTELRYMVDTNDT